MQFEKGKYLTECGLEAVVARIQQIGPDFYLRGAIRNDTGELVIHTWRLSGHSVTGCASLNLVPND